MEGGVEPESGPGVDVASDGALAGADDAAWELLLGVEDVDELEEAEAVWKGSE